MTDDLVKRLRDRKIAILHGNDEPFREDDLCQEAAARITAIEASELTAFQRGFEQGKEMAAELSESKANNHGWDYHLPSVGREIAAAIRAIPVPDKMP